MYEKYKFKALLIFPWQSIATDVLHVLQWIPPERFSSIGWKNIGVSGEKHPGTNTHNNCGQNTGWHRQPYELGNVFLALPWSAGPCEGDSQLIWFPIHRGEWRTPVPVHLVPWGRWDLTAKQCDMLQRPCVVSGARPRLPATCPASKFPKP